MIKRVCPECSGPLVLLTSINKKLCSDCKRLFDWNLDPNQDPIHDSKRND